MKTSFRALQSQRGSLLIVALLLSAIIAISLTSYLRLARTTLVVSNRALYNNAAMNLAEQGLEEAMYSLNKSVSNPTFNWSGAGAGEGWTVAGGDAKRDFPGVNLSQGSTATYRVYVYNNDLANPAPKILVSRSSVTLGGVSGTSIFKYIQVTCRKASKFANGLVAKNSVVFNGNNATVDSWNSDPDNNTATAAVPYSSSVQHDKGSVASASVSVGNVSVNQADIFGYVATNSGVAPTVGNNGRIGTLVPLTPVGTIDSTRVDTNFSANFDPVTAPSGSYKSYGGTYGATTYPTVINTDMSLPRAGIDNVMGTGDYAGYYMITADSINYNNEVLTITAKVVLNLTNSLDAISVVGGSGEIKINSGATLVVFGSGDMKIGGQGITNGGTTLTTANQPVNCQFYGTKTSGAPQDIRIAGNGVLSAVVYAPYADVKINGNGDVMGSVVANNIDVVGNALFHYDESLADFGVSNPFRIQSWKELTTGADRTSTVANAVNWSP